MRVVILGYLVRGPVGGLAWHHLQYLLGLSELGHDAYFFETTDGHLLYDPDRLVFGTDPSYGLKFAADAFARIGFDERWAFYDENQASWIGPSADRAEEIARSADLVLNLSGVNALDPWFSEAPFRVLVDTDPAFTQVRHLTVPGARDRAAGHNAFFTFGENIESELSTVPVDGFPWQGTRQPISMAAWRATEPAVTSRLSTVMLWDSYASVRYRGRYYGMKSDSFGPYVDLPSRSALPLELAVGGGSAPRDMLKRSGWYLRDPIAVGRDPWSYQEYIRGSLGEFSVAKHGYVVTRSGWFSERSAAYLASGRPVIVEDTGFTQWLDTDRAVLPFRNRDGAMGAIEELAANYSRHQRDSRAVAEEYFSGRKILTSLIERGTSRSSLSGESKRHKRSSPVSGGSLS